MPMPMLMFMFMFMPTAIPMLTPMAAVLAVDPAASGPVRRVTGSLAPPGLSPWRDGIPPEKWSLRPRRAPSDGAGSGCDGARPVDQLALETDRASLSRSGLRCSTAGLSQVGRAAAGDDDNDDDPAAAADEEANGSGGGCDDDTADAELTGTGPDTGVEADAAAAAAASLGSRGPAVPP
ncbi:hypothetical protein CAUPRSCDRAFT_11504 [Caulochytrium protostelioides]|uniref:Secreted protein n=1 Tax=Caulochytrium protostelioides TaxID=1555241 RepID=A0A4P9WU11_9FUNG|nr:hypothetical protein CAUPRSCDRAFT_11504 [Caulochytrium protostelioides]